MIPEGGPIKKKLTNLFFVLRVQFKIGKIIYMYIHTHTHPDINVHMNTYTHTFVLESPPMDCSVQCPLPEYRRTLHTVFKGFRVHFCPPLLSGAPCTPACARAQPAPSHPSEQNIVCRFPKPVSSSARSQNFEFRDHFSAKFLATC